MDGDEECDKVRTVENVFWDFERRRAGIIRALTTDFQEFRGNCDPDDEHLCLYGHPNEQWEVKKPDDEVPPDLPEPVLGINLVRDTTPEEDWLPMVALRSDIWLLSIAYFFGAEFDEADRQRLFAMINELPTVYEVVTGKAKIHIEENSREEDKGEDESDKQKDAPCGVCRINDVGDGFWIHCFYCKVTYHGKCVKISPVEASELMIYNCPSCLYSYELDEPDEEDDEDEPDEEEESDGLCGVCREEDVGVGWFMICCIRCNVWYHGECVDLTLSEFRRMDSFTCPFCLHTFRS